MGCISPRTYQPHAPKDNGVAFHPHPSDSPQCCSSDKILLLVFISYLLFYSTVRHFNIRFQLLFCCCCCCCSRFRFCSACVVLVPSAVVGESSRAPSLSHRCSPLKTPINTSFLVLHLLFLPLAVPVMPPTCCGCLSQYTHHHLVAFLLTFFR